MPWMACRTLCVGMVKQRGSVFGFPPSPPGQAQGERSPEVKGSDPECQVVFIIIF